MGKKGMRPSTKKGSRVLKNGIALKKGVEALKKGGVRWVAGKKDKTLKKGSRGPEKKDRTLTKRREVAEALKKGITLKKGSRALQKGGVRWAAGK